MNRVYFGDCRDTMRYLKAQGVRVQCCVTSPPYYGLRDYGHPGQIGLEKTPAEYVAALVEVFEGVRELLADDGVLWLNLGDSYGHGTSASRKASTTSTKISAAQHEAQGGRHGGPAKQLLGIPWRVALAMQDAGWYLRQDVIWHKPNPMPESVTDRCTKAHEYLFLMSKSERYFWDSEAMKEDAVGQNLHDLTGPGYAAPGQTPNTGNRSKRDSFKRDASKRAEVIPGQTVGTHRADRDESEWDTGRRNRRSVWTVPTQPYAGAHFAVFPAALIEPCILAGSRPGDLVLDPFMGSGTTAQVAQALGRQWIGCELNTEYAPLQQARTAQAALAI